MRHGEDPLLTQLNDSIVNCLNGYRQQTTRLGEQTDDLQMQMHILQRQRRDTEAIIYSIRDAVIVTDSFDRLLMANEPAQTLFGFEINDAQLKPIEELIHNNELIDLFRKSRQGKIPHVRCELVIDVDNEPRTFDCIISCVKDEAGLPSGIVAALHDITREKQISQMKTDFVSHVSHELKTPLSSITAYAEMLVEGEITDKATQNECYSAIHSQAQRLNRMIEDILNISRIESGLIKINKEPISLALLVKDAVRVIENQAAEKNIKVSEKSSIVCDQVNADKDMMSRVIINLLSNAVKYTPSKGKVTIETVVDESDNIVKVSVSDTGVGIPEDEVKHVFEKFYRVSANKKCAKGTGLGLNLVKQIVEKVHDGQVFVQSRQGQGSTFGFELPLRAGQEAVVT
jgi:two-component system phosphate regulon sensor histidine kinase PhoR